MKVWKLVSGILSMVLFILVAFQSCAAGVSNALENNGEVSGSAGLIVAGEDSHFHSLRNKKVRKDGRQYCADHLIRTGCSAWIFKLRKLFRSDDLVCLVSAECNSGSCCDHHRKEESVNYSSFFFL